MKAGFVALALLATVAAPGHAGLMPWPVSSTPNGASQFSVAYKPDMEWTIVEHGAEVAVNEGPRLVGVAQTGKVTYRLVFACSTAPGRWWPSRWNGYKAVKIFVYAIDPSANYETSQFGGVVTITTSTGSFDVVPEYTLRYTDSMGVTMIASDRIMDVQRRESTLHVRFGDAASRVAFAFDIASGRSKILDFANSCK